MLSAPGQYPVQHVFSNNSIILLSNCLTPVKNILMTLLIKLACVKSFCSFSGQAVYMIMAGTSWVLCKDPCA